MSGSLLSGEAGRRDSKVMRKIWGAMDVLTALMVVMGLWCLHKIYTSVKLA